MSQFEKVRSKTPFLYLLSHLIVNKDAFTNSIETSWFRADDLTGKQVQNEVKCSAFDMEMIFILVQITLIFTKKGCALGLILKGRVFGTRKWTIVKNWLTKPDRVGDSPLTGWDETKRTVYKESENRPND